MRCRVAAARTAHQRGVASIAVVALLMIGLSLALLHVHRGLVTDITAAANEERSVRAFEAAEAGLAWATSQLNNPEPINARCEPAAGESAASRSHQTFLERIGLGHDPVLASRTTRGTAGAAGGAAGGPASNIRTAAASCVRRGGAWHCTCPQSTAAGAGPLEGATHENDAAFSLSVSVDPTHTAFQVVSQGCSGGEDRCAPLQLDAAVARVRQAFERLVLFRPHDLLAPGGSAASSFEGVLGMTPAAFSQLPSVATTRCAGDCTPALAMLAGRGFRLIRVEGHAEIRSRLTLGTPEKPVLMAVSGTLTLGAPLQFTGLLHVVELVADERSHGSQLRGAVLSIGPTPDLEPQALSVDAAVLTELAQRAGPILPLPGSWDER